MQTILLSLYLAWRLYRNPKKNKTISFISIVSIIGNASSIAILIICLSAINGFKNELNERIFSIIPHGNIQSTNSTFSDWNIILNKIKNIPGIVQSVPYVDLSGLIEKNNKFHPIQIHGISTLHNMHPNIISYLSSINTIPNFVPNKQIIILGQGVANTLNIKKNDWINIIIHNTDGNNKLLPYKFINAHVIDILNLKSYLDNNIAIIPLSDAQNYLNKQKYISGINIKINNIFHINKLLKQIINTIKNDHIITQSWINTYKYMYQDIHIIETIIYLTMTLVICIACFGIVSILTLIIKEKNHDIAILNTLGCKNKLIYSTFIWCGLLHSLISIAIGTTSGTLIALYLTKIYFLIENLFDYKILSHNVYFINFLPTEVHTKDIISIITINLLLSFLATLYPIIKTNYSNPGAILK
ncbi:FtsX-like permease family protein [Blochmannia endosymbiont of Polyrhachis (Hedomyrma) turneri]|uniref:FtsX-like permease family protein n=1 Tax=Blochmannia endosymbiont of Polyrhachis (Hedomyrma) turneri TaxID=1505596 RepID=UPI00061A669E|nr:FtsX-like permease family protein [Blochmannia endosymbiont of Polyrhachis (Hedomyrma) turneri]AKC59959.1 Lipoprotein-releasing system transmembrane protein LolE [Blochmannia endosymbiont of Polyrhachis (Hedomyrma) turneri]